MQIEIPEDELQTIISGLGSALEAMTPDSVERTALRTLLRRLTIGREQDRGAGIGDVRGPTGTGVDSRGEPGRMDTERSTPGSSNVMGADVSSSAGQKAHS